MAEDDNRSVEVLDELSNIRGELSILNAEVSNLIDVVSKSLNEQKSTVQILKLYCSKEQP
jgi:hypothetical protein